MRSAAIRPEHVIAGVNGYARAEVPDCILMPAFTESSVAFRLLVVGQLSSQ
jgi:hypothetical protein